MDETTELGHEHHEDPRRALSDDAAAAVSLDVRFDLYGYARLEAS